MSKKIQPPRLSEDLRELKLPGFSEHWQRLSEAARRRRQNHAEYLEELAHLELTGRRERRIARLIREAKFPVLKTLEGFDFSLQKDLDQAAIDDHATCDFIGERSNVVFVGGVGTGKTHLAIALGLSGCQREKRVRYVTAAELTTTLIEAKAADKLSRKLNYFARFDLVVLDELGYVPFDRAGADLLFGFVTKVYERRSLIVTTNLPFGRWSEVFHDATAAAAVIDRIVHHAQVFKMDGESYRLREAKSRGQKKKRSKK
jgi:DNA replication protein DnaC